MNESSFPRTGLTASAPLGAPAGPATRAGALAPILLQYWWMVLRWKWVILGIIAAFLLGGFIITLSTAPKYTATTQIEISRDQKKITNVEGVEPADRSRDIEFYQTQYSLLTARSLGERVVRELKLANDDAFFAAHGAALSKEAASRPDAAAQRQRMATSLVLGGIKVGPVRGSSLVNLAYTSRSPEISARIANAWAQQFIEQTLERRFASTADARTFLERRLSQMRGRLENSERQLTNYAVDKGIVRLSTTQSADGKTRTDRTLVSDDLEALNAALASATNERLLAESAVGAAASAGSSTASLNSSAIATLRQRRAEVSAELARNLTQFEAEYPANQALRQQVAALDSSIAREEGRVTGSLRANYQQSLGREQGLQQRVNSLKSKLDLQQRDAIQFNILQREADSNRTLYDGLLQRYKEIGVAGIASNDIAIVDTALPPTGPSSPRLMFNLALALLAGVVVAGGATQALDQIDEGVRDASQVTNALNLPLLGSVPFLPGVAIEQATRDVQSVISEAHLTARSSLSLTTEHGVPRSFVVTSTRPAEGKSSTALGLALALARSGKRVLLVDGDMRRPSQHTLLGLPHLTGLSTVLAGDDDWQRHVQSTDLGLDFLSSGARPPSAAELLSSDRLRRMVGVFLQSYDHVVADAPPMLGLADAALIGGAVEGAVYVIEVEQAPLRAIRASVDRLLTNQVHIFGVILTKMKRRTGTYGYGYGYGYEYDYDYGREDRDGDGNGNLGPAGSAPASIARLGGGNLRARLSFLQRYRGNARS